MLVLPEEETGILFLIRAYQQEELLEKIQQSSSSLEILKKTINKTLWECYKRVYLLIENNTLQIYLIKKITMVWYEPWKPKNLNGFRNWIYWSLWVIRISGFSEE